MKYELKQQRNLPVKAQVLGEVLEKIREANGGELSAKLVVESATPKKSPLHRCFEWDNKTAADLYREDQARYIIRSIVIVEDEKEGAIGPIRAFVSVVQDDKQFYTSVLYAMSDVELREQVLKKAWKELRSWRERYNEFKELAKVFSVIDTTQEELDKVA